MKKLLLNIYLLILLLSLPYNAYSQVYLPNSNTWNKYVNNALENAGKYINNNEDKIFDIVKKSYKASKTNSVYISVNNLSLLLISLQKINKSFQNFYSREIYGFTYYINQLPVIIKNNKAYFKLKNEKDIKKWNDTIDYTTDMIMNDASIHGYTTWQTPQSIINKRNKVEEEKRKAEEERKKAEQERKKAEEEQKKAEQLQLELERKKEQKLREEMLPLQPNNPKYKEVTNDAYSKAKQAVDVYSDSMFYEINGVEYIKTDFVCNELHDYNYKISSTFEPKVADAYAIIYLLEQVNAAYNNKYAQQLDNCTTFIKQIPIRPMYSQEELESFGMKENVYIIMIDNVIKNKLDALYQPIINDICK